MSATIWTARHLSFIFGDHGNRQPPVVVFVSRTYAKMNQAFSVPIYLSILLSEVASVRAKAYQRSMAKIWI
ncbi:hypothetical protein MKX03_022350 [Papaver bracteatum]|nr:hypothetical protein MKX03_022350 [Papaver bracteatum]